MANDTANNSMYSIGACPAGDWYVASVTVLGGQSKTLYQGHSKGQAYEAIVEHAGLSVSKSYYEREECE